MTESLTPETFTERMKDIIVDWPLYRRFQFNGRVTRTHLSAGLGPEPKSHAYATLPDQIEMFCSGSDCLKEQRWKLVEPHGNDVGRVFRVDREYVKVVYVCRNCERVTYTYWLFFALKKEGGVVIKVGQFPPLEREPSSVVASAMNEYDLLLYRHALTCRNSTFGIGAVAYLRRIVENRINYLLDLIADQAAVLEPESPLLAKLADMKGDKRFSALRRNS
ncbi:MAG: hypothetical protein ABSB35_42765 [Bryobacteraceae bacterium]|jgi:hypothetical protein